MLTFGYAVPNPTSEVPRTIFSLKALQHFAYAFNYAGILRVKPWLVKVGDARVCGNDVSLPQSVGVKFDA